MGSISTALAQLWVETRLLVSQTFRTWFSLSVPILSLLGIGWAANELSTLVGAEVSCEHPWLVIPIISTCVVVQLACILAVLRLTAVQLGMPDLLQRTAGPDELADDRDTSPAHLMAITLLPFVGLYAGFGFLEQYARQLVVLSTYRCGPGLLGALEPSIDGDGRGINLYLLLAAVVGLFLVRLVLDVLRERTRRPLVPALVQIAVETTMAFLVLLGGFRLFELTNLWFTDTVLYHQVIGWGAAIHDALPPTIAAGWDTSWEFLNTVIWPVVMNGAVRPFLWLAMGGLVFGSRLLSLADLWFINRGSRPVVRPLTWLTRLQQSSETARGFRLLGSRGAALLLEDAEEKLLPAWQSLRLVLHAGWPFLAAFTVVFALLDLAQDLPELLLNLWLGGHPVWYWVRLWPFQDLMVQVFVMSFVWVMLAVAYTRGLSIFVERNGSAAVGELLRPGMALGGGNRVQSVTVVAVAAALVVGIGAIPRNLEADIRATTLGVPVSLNEDRVVVATPRVAKSIESFGNPVESNLVFVVVPVALASPGPRGESYRLELVAGERTYSSFTIGVLVAPAGFRVAKEFAFEIQPEDLRPGTTVIVRPHEFVSGYQQWAEVPLELATLPVLPTTELTGDTYREAA